MRFKNVFPVNEVFGWGQMRHMHETQYILMHNIFYRTQLLKDCRPAASEAYLLRGQYFCISAVPVRGENLLYGRKPLPLLHRP